jgi:hypothetical protein
MGTLILSLAGICVPIIVGLLVTWARAELSAFYEPLINWLVANGCKCIPEEARAECMAEVLSINSAIKSPTRRLWDAGSFYLLASRSAGAVDNELSAGAVDNELSAALKSYHRELRFFALLAGSTIGWMSSMPLVGSGRVIELFLTTDAVSVIGVVCSLYSMCRAACAGRRLTWANVPKPRHFPPSSD